MLLEFIIEVEIMKLKKIKLNDIWWVYSIDCQTSIPFVINHEENKFWDLETNIVHTIPDNTTLKDAVEQIYKIENAVISSTINMINEFSSSSNLDMLTSSTIRNLEFSDIPTYEYCETHKIGRLEINALSKVFNRSLKSINQRLKRIQKQMQEEDVKSF